MREVEGMFDPSIYAQSAVDNAVNDAPDRASVYAQLAIAAAVERLAKAIETSKR